MLLKDCVAIVTGSSGGIGREIALLFAACGADLALHYHRDQTSAEAVAEQVRALGRRALVARADISQPEQAEQMMEAVVAELGQIDILVNNAGITGDGLLVTTPPEDIDTVIRTNLLGTIFCTRAAAPHMIRRRSGRIVNVSSSAASKPGRGQSSYAAAKGGVEAFTRAMAVELASRNILVNALAPGVIRTEMSRRIREVADDEIMARLLLKRYAEPEEVAEAALFLASSRNRFLTGEVIHLDGGLKMA